MLTVVTKTRESVGEAAERTCAGCREPALRGDLLRFVHVPGNDPCMIPDVGGRLAGHGVWIHPKRDCLRRAVRGGFARALKTGIMVDAAQLAKLAQDQFDRRVQGLLLAAMRRHEVVLGTDAVREALLAGAPCLLLVAKDAAGRREDLIQIANTRRVPVVEFGSKAALGHLTRKETLGFLAVLDAQIAREIKTSARWLAGLSEDG